MPEPQTLLLSGKVVDAQCNPVAAARVEVTLLSRFALPLRALGSVCCCPPS